MKFLYNFLFPRYIARNDEELEQINIKRSISSNRKQQHIGRENAICLTKERETNDYNTCGFGKFHNIFDFKVCVLINLLSFFFFFFLQKFPIFLIQLS